MYRQVPYFYCSSLHFLQNLSHFQSFLYIYRFCFCIALFLVSKGGPLDRTGSMRGSEYGISTFPKIRGKKVSTKDQVRICLPIIKDSIVAQC